MSNDPHHIPVPPVLLTVVPFFTMGASVILAVSVFPGGGLWIAFASAVAGFFSLPHGWPSE